MVNVTDNLSSGLRRVREARGLSLRAVATAVGISPSLLSQVETGKTHPSVSTLYAIVTYLGVSLDEIIGNTATPASNAPTTPERLGESSPRVSPVQFAEDAPSIEMEKGVTWVRQAIGGLDIVDPLVTIYAPGGSSSIEGRLMRHAGIEYGYIIEGELTLKLEFETYLLKAGDSLCFDSTRPHLYINHTDKVTRGLWFVVGRNDLAACSRSVTAHHLEGVGNRPVKSIDVLAAVRQMPSESSGQR